MTGLANDVADLSTNKFDKTVNGLALRYVTETFNDGTNWYRKWSDGWLEQGATTVPVFAAHRSSNKTTVSFALPFSSFPGVNCTLISAVSGDLATSTADVTTTSFVPWLSADDGATSGRTGKWYWFAQGNGYQS